MRRVFLASFALVLLSAGSAPAATLFSDNFDTEALGLNVPLTQWTVSDGTIDVIGNPGFNDFLPGNGRYVDLDGSSGDAGKITSSAFSFVSGQNYLLQFSLAGSQRGDTNTVTLSVGSLVSDTITLTSSVGFTSYSYGFVGNGSSAPIVFDHAGRDNIGLLLDNVTLSTVEGTSVPEPASIASFALLGVGLLAARRRGRK